VLVELGREFPGIDAALLTRLHRELGEVGRDAGYHRQLFGHAALPRTFALLAQYPEHDRLWALFPAAQRSEA
jgi:hypothetical protein